MRNMSYKFREFIFEHILRDFYNRTGKGKQKFLLLHDISLTAIINICVEFEIIRIFHIHSLYTN